MTAPLLTLQNKLNYQFRDASLLELALKHRSVGNSNNERLEFLGDGILNFVIAAALFELRQKSSEGELTRYRASLVRKETLAQIAKAIEVAAFIILGPGELKAGGARRDSILADAVEAILGAIYVDGGFDECRRVILELYTDRLENLPNPEKMKDPKTRLQEWLQQRNSDLPAYDIVDIQGQEHAQTFRVVCRANSMEAEGEGSSRRKAEQAAAEKVFALLLEKRK